MLANPFIFYIDHQELKFLFNKTLHHGLIYRWILLFQEIEFEIIVKLGKTNVGPEHLSRVDMGEDPIRIDDEKPYTHKYQNNKFIYKRKFLKNKKTLYSKEDSEDVEVLFMGFEREILEE